MPKVLVGLLNWNRSEDLRRLIHSVLRDLSRNSWDSNCRIIVVDN